jgi:hypothetical protein
MIIPYKVVFGQTESTYIMKALTRHGALTEEEEGMTYLPDIESDAALALLQSAA